MEGGGRLRSGWRKQGKRGFSNRRHKREVAGRGSKGDQTGGPGDPRSFQKHKLKALRNAAEEVSEEVSEEVLEKTLEETSEETSKETLEETLEETSGQKKKKDRN